MVHSEMEALAARIEVSGALDTATLAALRTALVKEAGAVPVPAVQDLRSIEEIIHLLDRALPGWSIHLDGTAHEPNGHWHCALRPSALRDNDEFIGYGKGPMLSNALLAALLRVLTYLSSRTTAE